MSRPRAGLGVPEHTSPALWTALAVRFLLELALLVGVAVVAWACTSSGWRWLAALVAVIAVATVWGLVLSPKATFALPALVVLVIEAVLFLTTGLGLYFVGHGAVAIIGSVIWILDRVAIVLLSRKAT